MPGAALVHFTLRAGGGEQRLQTWERLLAANGLSTTRVSVLATPLWRRPGIVGHGMAVLAGDVPPEAMAWSRALARRRLAAVQPDVVVFVTLRAFDPALCTPDRAVIVDHVDCLSQSYRQRAAVTRDIPRAACFRLLAAATARVERRMTVSPWPQVAAGLADARLLGAEWLPILPPSVEPTSDLTPRGRGGRDVLFVGTLDYPPNIDAIRAWRTDVQPWLERRGLDVRLVVGGRRPTAEVRQIVAEVSGELVEDFDDFTDLAHRAAAMVVPLRVATGMQIKLLDAARSALPIVATPVAMRGVDGDFPAEVAPLGAAFAARIADLLGDPDRAAALASAAQRHVATAYSVERWAEVVRAWLPASGSPFPAQD